MWSSNEDEDPWAQGSKSQPSVGFERKFVSRPENLTSYRYPGNSHDPLIRPGEIDSLRAWLNKNFAGRAVRDTSGMVYEEKLPLIQERLQSLELGADEPAELMALLDKTTPETVGPEPSNPYSRFK